MASRLDEFREFVARFPKVHDEVASGRRTWQQIYEDWVILGENHHQWVQYQDENKAKEPVDYLSADSLKNALNYLKRINPDSISRTLNTISKVLQITQGFQNRRPNTLNSNYNSWWD